MQSNFSFQELPEASGIIVSDCFPLPIQWQFHTLLVPARQDLALPFFHEGIDDLSPGVLVLRHRLFHLLRVHHRRHGAQPRVVASFDVLARRAHRAEPEVYVGSALDDPQTPATATPKAETPAIATSFGSPLSLHVA